MLGAQGLRVSSTSAGSVVKSTPRKRSYFLVRSAAPSLFAMAQPPYSLCRAAPGRDARGSTARIWRYIL